MNITLGRPHLSSVKMGTITQGTIFTCAIAMRYKNSVVHGLTITARCDLAQDKYRILNYVPIVPLSEWLKVDGVELLCSSEKAEISGRVKDLFESNSIPKSLLRTNSLQDIAEELYLKSPDKAIKEIGKKLTKLHDLKTEFENIEKLSNDEIWAWFSKNKFKKSADLIKRLSKQDVTGFYFLERLIPNDTASGYVCLLREITTLPRDVVDSLRSGISKTVWVEQRQDEAGYLNFSIDDFAMPISKISSPTIEHVMQCFSTLFGRIGLPDPIEDEISSIISLCCNNLEDGGAGI